MTQEVYFKYIAKKSIYLLELLLILQWRTLSECLNEQELICNKNVHDDTLHLMLCFGKSKCIITSSRNVLFSQAEVAPMWESKDYYVTWFYWR